MKLKNKLALLLLMSMLASELTACNNNNENTIANIPTTEKSTDDNIEISNSDALSEINPTIENIEESDLAIEPSVEEIDEPLFINYKTVTAITNVNIRDKDVDGNIIGVLPEGRSLKLLYTLENNWYEVEYYGKTAYVSGEYVVETTENDINRLIEKTYYAKEDINLTIPSLLSETGIEENVILPKLECLEVYDQMDNKYLVKTNEYIGYVNKDENLEELTGTFVVVDISNQELTLYCDNEILLKTPVVTGKPSTPSDLGCFAIYDISRNRYLIGDTYKTYVEYMLKYNGGEGLHDAEYCTHEDGFSHGWRSPEEFGAKTNLIDGSHGCINMLRGAVVIVYEQVEIGTKVLVKK